MPREEPVRTWGGVGRPHTQEKGLGIRDADAWMVRLDLLPAGVQPQHVGRHGPLGGVGVLALLYLCRNPEAVSHLLPTKLHILPKR